MAVELRTVEKLSEDELIRILDGLNLLKEVSHANAIDKGFVHPGERRHVGELVALMHSEVSEFLEGFREGVKTADKIPPYSILEEELADLLIRIGDTAAEYDLDIAGAVIKKSQFNRTRPTRHGKAF